MRSTGYFPILAVLCTASVQAITNPVIDHENVPDPGAILWKNAYYVATTAGPHEGKFPIHKSTDLQTWEFQGYALPRDHAPSWAQSPDTDFWAPELHEVNPGRFNLYYTLRDNTGALCIAVATSESITGPYTDSGKPLVRYEDEGVIDATFYKSEDGTKYLIWKDDGNGNRPQRPTIIWAQQLTDDGIELIGQKQELIRNDLAWEGDVTEGPWLIHRSGFYYLFYSGHGYCDASYAVGVARSKHPLGPYEKHGDPILFT